MNRTTPCIYDSRFQRPVIGLRLVSINSHPTVDQFEECAILGPASFGTEIRRKSPSPQEHSFETPIGLIVPSGCCSATYTESQVRQTATILEWDWVMATERISTGITILPQ